MVDIKINENFIHSVDAVIFDKDGTLTDSHFYWAEIIRRRARKLCSIYNLSDNEYKNIVFVMGLDLEKNKLMPEGPIAIKSRNEVITALERYLRGIGIVNSFNIIVNVIREVNSEFSDITDYIKPIDECVSLVKKLKKFDIKTILLTSDTTKNATITTNHLQITDYFDLIQGIDDISEKKSSGKSAMEICKKMNLLPKNVVAIGDTEVDFLMANNAGLCGCILVATGQITMLELLKRTKCSVPSLNFIELL